MNRFTKQLLPFCSLIFIFSLCTFLEPDNFLTTKNLVNVLCRSSINGIMAAGMTYIIISGGIDLSVGSMLAMCGMIGAVSMLFFSVNTKVIQFEDFDPSMDIDRIEVTVAADDCESGAEAAQRLGAALKGRGRIVLACFGHTADSTGARVKGFRDALAKQYSGIEIVELFTDDADESAILKTGEMLVKQSGINGIFAVNRDTSLGVYKALQSQKLAGKIKFVGFGSDPVLLDGIEKDEVDSIIVQDPYYNLGYTGVRTVISLINGQKVEKKKPIPGMVVNKDNLDKMKEEFSALLGLAPADAQIRLSYLRKGAEKAGREKKCEIRWIDSGKQIQSGEEGAPRIVTALIQDPNTSRPLFHLAGRAKKAKELWAEISSGNYIRLTLPAMLLGTLICIAAGAICGFLNGMLITRLKLAPFIVTLGTMSIFRGISYIMNAGKPFAVSDYSWLDTGRVWLDTGHVVGIPSSIILLVIVMAAAGFLLKCTRFGRYTYAIGSNTQTAFHAGINVNWMLVGIYTLTGALVGLASMITVSRASTAQPTAGISLELDIIAAAIIGGCAPSGGRGNMIGTVIGTMLIAFLRNGLTLLDISTNFQLVVIGLIIIVAVTADQFATRRKAT